MQQKTKVAIISAMVTNPDSVERLNAILHEYRSYIIGRMGLPYHKKSVSIISVAVDAKSDIINALSGKIGNLDGVSAKTVSSDI